MLATLLLLCFHALFGRDREVTADHEAEPAPPSSTWRGDSNRAPSADPAAWSIKPSFSFDRQNRRNG